MGCLVRGDRAGAVSFLPHDEEEPQPPLAFACRVERIRARILARAGGIVLRSPLAHDSFDRFSFGVAAFERSIGIRRR